MKKDEYEKLVEKRKDCRFCQDLKNPAELGNDSNEIGPWSRWQGNLDTEILVVGQDWGGVAAYEKVKGKESDNNTTDRHLRHLLEIIGVRIERPQDDGQGGVIFLTNLILCMKPGNEQAPIRDEWLVNCTRKFFIPLVNIIRPRIVIVLGKHPSEAILDAYRVEYPRNLILSKLMERSPYRLTDSTVLFPVYHCGAGGTNRNRPMPVQEQDWQRFRKYTEGHDTGQER